jgi:hypothetical protein
MAQKTSKGQEGYYARYKSAGVHAKNRRIKLERQLKLQPNNEQVAQALKDIKYRRKTPGANGWSHSGIALAKVFKEFCGSFSQDIFSSNPKTASDAMHSLRSKAADFKLPKEVTESISNKAMFSLKARLKAGGVYLHANAKSLAV